MRIIKTCKFCQEREHDHESRARFYCLTSTITSLLRPTLTVVFRSRARFFSLGRNAELDYYPSRRCGESGELTLSFILSPLSFWKWEDLAVILKAVAISHTNTNHEHEHGIYPTRTHLFSDILITAHLEPSSSSRQQIASYPPSFEFEAPR